MFTPMVKVTVIVFVSLLLIASGLWFSSGDSPKPQAAEANDSKLKDLLKEKLVILREVASAQIDAQKVGQVSFAEVYEANQAVRNAELDLCDTATERGVVLEKMLASAKDHENNIALLAEASEVPTIAAIKAKVSRLDVEIALARVRAR